MTAIVLASVGSESRQFTDLGRLWLQECERVAALRTELQRCGVSVSEEGDTLRVQPGRIAPATIETYQDLTSCMSSTCASAPHPALHPPASASLKQCNLCGYCKSFN